jgi:hypothetical protein
MGLGKLTSHEAEKGTEQIMQEYNSPQVSTNPYDYGFTGPEDFDMSKVGGLMSKNSGSVGWNGSQQSADMSGGGTPSIGWGDMMGGKKQIGTDLATKGVKKLIKSSFSNQGVTPDTSNASSNLGATDVDLQDTAEEADSILDFL